jgi:hypothetical protein
MTVPAAVIPDACGCQLSAPQTTTAQIPSGVRPLVIRLQQRWVQERPGEIQTTSEY